jgi:hypothetical protein
VLRPPGSECTSAVMIIDFPQVNAEKTCHQAFMLVA